MLSDACISRQTRRCMPKRAWPWAITLVTRVALRCLDHGPVAVTHVAGHSAEHCVHAPVEYGAYATRPAQESRKVAVIGVYVCAVHRQLQWPSVRWLSRK